MEPFFISEERLSELAATRQGRISIGGFNYQAAYAVARLVSMLIKRPLFDVSDFPVQIRYDWGEDLDEVCNGGKVIFTQCKKIDQIGQPAALSLVLLSFAAKWLLVPSDQRGNVYFRLVCTDQRFQRSGVLSAYSTEYHSVKSNFLRELNSSPGARSDRALWQSEADLFDYQELFLQLWQRTEVLFINSTLLSGHPAGPLLSAEREALEYLLTYSQITSSKQSDALGRLRRLIHDNLITFDPSSDAEMILPYQAPRFNVFADIANALAPYYPAAENALPFELVDRTFLSEQREKMNVLLRQEKLKPFVARQPSWIDVVDGANEQVKFVERSITLEMKEAIVSALVEPIENGQDRRLHMFFLVGSPGSGKTTLVRRIAAMLLDEGRIVVADAGLDVHEPSASPEEYIESLFRIVAHGRPVILLLDDPLYSDSPWIAILKKLNRPGLRISVLAACPQMLFDSHKGRLVFGVVKHLNIGAPTEPERAEMRRLYGRTSEALNSADEFLVITMEAAAGYPFDEIIQRLWLTLNDGQPLPDVWEEAAWSLQAFMVVSSFHRYYLPCVLPILSAVLDQSSMSKPSGNISNNLARLQAEDGWLVFRFSEHDNKCWSYQGTPVFTAHQRIAQRAWELRPMHWIDIGDKIIQASLIVPQSIRYVGHLAARCRISENNHDQSFVDNLVSKWSNDDNLSHIETRQLCELVAMLLINGQQNIALRFERILITRAGRSSDGWLAALILYFLKNGKKLMADFPETLNLAAIIACSDFSIAPNRASKFFSRLPKPLASLFIARLLNAFDGNLSWNLDCSLLAMLLRIAQYEMVNRISDIELWLKVHSDDTTVRNGYLGLLSKQELSKEQLDRVMRETEAWLEKHGDDTHVRNGYLGLLSKQELEKEPLDKVMRETEAWLEKHGDDTNVRNGYLGLLSKQELSKEQYSGPRFSDSGLRW